jgi:hypothetical protein
MSVCLLSSPVSQPIESVVTEISIDADKVRSWRCGQIVVRDGELVTVHRRFFGASASIVQVIWQAGWGRSNNSQCVIDYHSPLGMPGFITLDYIRAGQTAGYRTFRQAVRVLEQIAQIKKVHAIVAHVTNPLITDRLLTRLGWERHCLNWKGRHWIRRFDHSNTVGRTRWPTVTRDESERMLQSELQV